MNLKKLFLAIVVIGLIAAFFISDLQSYFNLEYFQTQRQNLLDFKAANFWLSSLAYFVMYVVVAALSLPAAAVITLVGGAVFGFWWGLLLVSFASTIGATLAFLLARTILRDWVQSKFGSYLKPINRGMEKDGIFYLFTLRLIPVFPFFLVNVLMGLTPVKTRTFYWVSQLGMLFGTALYVNVGAQLGMATSLPGVLSIGVIRAILVLAIFPWLAKAGVAWLKKRKIMAPFSKPKSFDTNMVVIGAGSAGLVTSYIAALVKAKVTLIEKHKMGGDCLNTGCVPSKALIRSASVKHLIDRAQDFGLANAQASVSFPEVMQRIKTIIARIEPHDSVARYTSLGVDCVQGEATILSPYTVKVNGQTITTRNIVIATGARPFIPSIPGLEDIGYLTSDTVWEMQELPARLLVLGGGPIGCELSQAFARLGASVTQINQSDRILAREDVEIAELATSKFHKEGITVLNNSTIIGFELRSGAKIAKIKQAEQGEQVLEYEFDELLLAVGRTANTEGFGLEELGVKLGSRGTVEVNEHLQTNYPNIFACGDVAGPYQFTHMAAFQAWFTAINSLFGRFKKFRVNYSVVPWATFIDPEIARVGLNEQEAKEQGIEYEVTRYGIDDLDRAIADSEDFGFVKILTVPGKDKILGVTIVGYHSAELINEFVLAMTHGIGLKKLMGTIHIYPTLSESNKFAASQWRKNHAPEWIYPWLEKFHRWMRS